MTHKLMKIPQDKNYLISLVKLQPVVLQQTNELRYSFEMPSSGATAVVDLSENGTYSFKVLPHKEPAYLPLDKKNKGIYEIKNLSNEAVIGLLDYFYRVGRITPENENSFAITDEYRYLKTYLMDQPLFIKDNHRIVAKKYIFDFPNNYMAKVLHKANNTFELTVFNNNDLKGRMELSYIFDLPHNTKCLTGLTNTDVVTYLHRLFSIPELKNRTLMDEYTTAYLNYIDREWDEGNYVMPDFIGYENKTFWNNVQDILPTLNVC